MFVTKRFKGLQALVLTLSKKIVKLEKEVKQIKLDASLEDEK